MSITKLSLTNGLINNSSMHLLGAGELFTTGSVFYVDSTTGSDDNLGKDPKFPKATIDGAINACTANKGDTIVVMPNHAETITAAAGIDMDVAGVSLIGLGVGENRPVITFSTATGADMDLDANDLLVKNIVFKCNIASQTKMLDVTGDDVIIEDCEFREGSATGLSFIIAGAADGDSDRLKIRNCKFHAPTAGNYDEAIQIAKDHTGIRIENCEIYGDFDEAGIEVPVGGNAQVDLQIKSCVITNLLTGQHAIQINGTSSTGKIIGNRVQTDAFATSIDAGGLEMYDNSFNGGTDQGGELDVPTKVGKQYVALKSTGSMVSGYGTADSPVTLFTVTGDVLVRVGASVDVAVTSTSNTGTLEVGVAGNTASLCAQDVVDATAFDVGDSWSLITAADANGAQLADEWLLVGNGVDIILTIGTNDMTAGDIDFYCQYIPLTAGSSVVAA